MRMIKEAVLIGSGRGEARPRATHRIKRVLRSEPSRSVNTARVRLPCAYKRRRADPTHHGTVRGIEATNVIEFRPRWLLGAKRVDPASDHEGQVAFGDRALPADFGEALSDLRDLADRIGEQTITTLDSAGPSFRADRVLKT